MFRGEEVANRTLEKMFSGEFAGRGERTLAADEIRALVREVYAVGFTDGRRVKPDACEKCGTKTTELTLVRFVPGVLSPPGAKPQTKKLTWMCATCRKKAIDDV